VKQGQPLAKAADRGERSETEVMETRLQKFRFIAMGISLCLAMALFFTGAFWVKRIYDRIDAVRIDEMCKLILRDVAYTQNAAAESLKVVAKKMGDGTSFSEFSRQQQGVVQSSGISFGYYSEARDPLASLISVSGTSQAFQFKTYSKWKSSAGKAETADKQDLKIENRLFDMADRDGFAASMVNHGGRLGVLTLVPIVNHHSDQHLGYLTRIEAVDLAQIQARLGIDEKGFALFSYGQMDLWTSDLKDAHVQLKGDDTYTTRLERRGAGRGYIRLQDFDRRPIFLLRAPWLETGKTGEMLALRWLLLTSLLFGGVVHLLSTNALYLIENKRRRFPGLSGLSTREFRDCVESFPGYAISFDRVGQIVAVSHALAGYLGVESSEAIGKTPQEIPSLKTFEWNVLASKLNEKTDWPQTELCQFETHSHGNTASFSGLAHCLKSRGAYFLVLEKQSLGVVLPFTSNSSNATLKQAVLAPIVAIKAHSDANTHDDLVHPQHDAHRNAQ
jgi:PAS domain-containing protein